MLDPLRLQSLVDGECTPDQRREILAQCESSPAQWRVVALALLEEQQFARSFGKSLVEYSEPKEPVLRRAVDENLPSQPETIARDSAGNQASYARPHSTPFVPQGRATPAPPSDSVRELKREESRSSWRPVLAASLIALAAFGVGRMSQSPSGVGGSSEGVDVGANDKSLVSHLADQPPKPDMHGRVGTEDIPIYTPQELPPELVLARQAYEIQRANQRLRKQGYEIDLHPRYMTGELEDGRQLIIPVHDVGIRAYGQ